MTLPHDAPTVLRYLDFDYSDAEDGTGTFDALVSTGPERVAAVHAEIAAVLGWAHAAFPAGRGPVEDGGTWDYDLHGMCEIPVPESLDYDESAGRIAVRPGAPGRPRHTASLSIGGSPAFCEALRERFRID
ncbi:MAG: hypothetical protein PGN26_06155 [Xylophilus ampelinus]